jgi:putative chitinase
MQKEQFYNIIREKLFNGKISKSQVEGIELFLNAGVDDKRHLAYILATVHHETAQTFQPIEEYGKGKGKPYGKQSPTTGQIYYGRGYVQITWESNYRRFKALLGIDLINHPELALNHDIALRITLTGMNEGKFTGKKLSDYFNEKKTDWVNARRIINGTDKAELIGDYAMIFYKALI